MRGEAGEKRERENMGMSGRRIAAGILWGALLCLPLAAQTAIVNARPVAGEQPIVLEYAADVDSGIIECLFDKGYIVFNQSSEDSPAALIRAGRETGADIVISWRMDEGGLSGTLIDCRSGEESPRRKVGERDFAGSYKNRHDMYTAMGVRLCEDLIPGGRN